MCGKPNPTFAHFWKGQPECLRVCNQTRGDLADSFAVGKIQQPKAIAHDAAQFSRVSLPWRNDGERLRCGGFARRTSDHTDRAVMPSSAMGRLPQLITPARIEGGPKFSPVLSRGNKMRPETGGVRKQSRRRSHDIEATLYQNSLEELERHTLRPETGGVRK